MARAQQDAYEKVIPRVPTKNGKILRLTPAQVLQALYLMVALFNQFKSEGANQQRQPSQPLSKSPSHLQQRLTYYLQS